MFSSISKFTLYEFEAYIVELESTSVQFTIFKGVYAYVPVVSVLFADSLPTLLGIVLFSSPYAFMKPILTANTYL